MNETWIVCYFAIALGLNVRIINTLHLVDFFQEYVFFFFRQRLERHLYYYQWKPIISLESFRYWCRYSQPTTNRIFEMRGGIITNNETTKIEREFRFSDTEVVYTWHKGLLITEGNKPVSFEEFQDKILSLIN